MPRSGQIIPEWLHPHEATYINDNTRYTDYAEHNTGTAFLNVFMSPKGVDNKVRYFDSVVDWVDTYGLPDYRRYGQASYNAYVSLSTGLATSQSMRIMPTNAVHANLILIAKYKVANGKLNLKFETKSVLSLTDADDLETYAQAEAKATADTEGFYTLPIMYFWSRGRGVYGNNYRVRISHDKGADRENDYVNYVIELLSTEDGSLATLEAYNVSFYIDAIDPDSSLTMFVNDIIDDEEGKGSKRFNMAVMSDNLETIFGAYKDAYNGASATTVTEYVDKLPVVSLPADEALFNVVDDGVYVYDAAFNTYNDWDKAAEVVAVAVLPAVGDAEPLTAYQLPDGTLNVVESGAFVSYNATTVTALPSTEVAVTGKVYILNSTGKAYTLVSGALAEYQAPEEEQEECLYTMETWDVFGYNKFTESQDPYFNFVDGLGNIQILQTEGAGMASGQDGDFADVGETVYDFKIVNGSLQAVPRVLTKVTREKAIEAAYLKAFQGGFDATIKSKRRAPVDLMLDACYSINVKKAMVALAKTRGDAACHLDTKLINNIADLETFYTQISDLCDRLVSFDAHMFKTSDPITGKVIPVSITLWLASKIPQHDYTYGNHTPFAGEEYATLSGYQKNSIRPVIDADDAETKELLYADLHMNYVECIAENTFMRGAQETSQNFWSDLSEENNMRVLLEIKRKIERLAASNRFKWADVEEQRLFKESCEEIFSSYIGTKCRELSIEVSSNSWEKTRYIVHVYMAVVFRTFQKRCIIEIDVNPRA